MINKNSINSLFVKMSKDPKFDEIKNKEISIDFNYLSLRNIPRNSLYNYVKCKNIFDFEVVKT